MPGTRKGKAAPKAAKVKSKVVVKPRTSTVPEGTASSKDKTAYEKLYEKLQTKRKAETKVKGNASKAKKAKDQQIDEMQISEVIHDTEMVSAKFLEDDNFIDMDISEMGQIFPSEDDDELSEGEIIEESGGEATNNNATIMKHSNASELSASHQGQQMWHKADVHEPAELPHCSNVNPEGQRMESSEENTDSSEAMTDTTFALIQEFMITKGIINNLMDEKQMREFIRMETAKPLKKMDEVGKLNSAKKDKQGKNMSKRVNHCRSEVTIYKRAVAMPSEETSTERQIDDFLNQSRGNLVEPIMVWDDRQQRKVSFSSEEFMDTSDETVPEVVITDNHMYIPDKVRPYIDNNKGTELTPEEQVDHLIREAEASKARMYDIPGKHLNIYQIDEDYQMIDSHIEESIKQKIQNYEYVDFCKLIARNCTGRDEMEQHLEIVNKNGMSYLSPVADRDNININGYGCWEQAFRVYSNILTSKFPGKATELLQYNHTIHSASTSYIWENVYAYDREFRRHIARHPYRSWAIILQQAWTMLLKDRIKFDNYTKGKQNGKKEICKCFNKVCCTYGLSCHYEHRCSVPKCGKFGHGAHICRMHNNGHDGDNVGTSSGTDNTNNSNTNTGGKK